MNRKGLINLFILNNGGNAQSGQPRCVANIHNITAVRPILEKMFSLTNESCYTKYFLVFVRKLAKCIHNILRAEITCI